MTNNKNNKEQANVQNKDYPDGFKSLRKEALELFGPMREPTEEERESVRRYLEENSVSTGINIFDIMDEWKEK